MDDLQKEILNIRQLMEKKTQKDMMPILQAYKRALDDVRAEILKIVARYVVDGQLKLSAAQRYSILKSLEKQLVEQAQQIGYIELETMTQVLSDVYSESYYRIQYTLEKQIPTMVTANFSLLRPEFVAAAVNVPLDGKRFSDRIWANKERLIKSLRATIEKGMIQGIDVRKLAREIKTEFDVGAYEAKRLMFTEMARVTSDAQEQIYKDSGVVQKVMWDSTLDSKTSTICRERDGQLYDLNSDHPNPPAHPFCRSCLVPVVEGWAPTKKRENIKNQDGIKPVIDYSTYEKWKQSKGIT